MNLPAHTMIRQSGDERLGVDPATDVFWDWENVTVNAEKTEQLLRRDGAVRASDHRLAHHSGDRAVVADEPGLHVAPLVVPTQDAGV